MSSPDGAPWPYEEGGSHDETPGVPTWECPDATCQCRTVSATEEKQEHRILFHDERARLMPGARCRVFENGRQINLESPYADGRGAIIVNVRRAPCCRSPFLVIPRSLHLG
jgi:hypothetical protein